MVAIALKAKKSSPTGNGDPALKLPSYAPQLIAFHKEFATELRSMLEKLPLRPGDRVLDVACGDGQWAAWLAQRVGRDGSVTAIDASPAWLTLAQDALRQQNEPAVKLCWADARRLPFAD